MGEAKEMKKPVIVLLGLLLISVNFLSGCTVNKIDEGHITLVVDRVEKRQYDDNGESPSGNSIFVYVYFTISNEDVDELSTLSLYFNLKSHTGKTYSPNWIFGSGGSEASAVSKGASASYYLSFDVDADDEITEAWELNFSSFQASKSANLAHIQPGFQDVFLATLTIDDYHYSDVGDYSWDTPAEGNTFLYVDITLSNSVDNEDNLNTYQWDFTLYTMDSGYSPDGSDDGKPDKIIPGGQASWYIYFEIPEDTNLDKLVYDTWGIAPAIANFS